MRQDLTNSPIIITNLSLSSAHPPTQNSPTSTAIHPFNFDARTIGIFATYYTQNNEGFYRKIEQKISSQLYQFLSTKAIDEKHPLMSQKRPAQIEQALNLWRLPGGLGEMKGDWVEFALNIRPIGHDGLGAN